MMLYRSKPRLKSLFTLMLAATAVLVVAAPAAARATPSPTYGKAVVVVPISGRVYVTLSGGSVAKVPRHKIIKSAARVPVGSVLDVSHGLALVVAAASHGGGTHAADITGGEVRVLQNRSQHGIVDFTLIGQRFGDCGKASAARVPRHVRVRTARRAGRSSVGDRASVGVFRTVGRFGRGQNVGVAAWDTIDECGGTRLVSLNAKVVTETRSGTLTQDLEPGKSISYRCADSYCLMLFTTDVMDKRNGHRIRDVHYDTGIALKTAGESYTLCTQGPSRTNCIPYPFDLPDAAGWRIGIVIGCPPDQGPGRYRIGWRLGGVSLGPPFTYEVPVRGDALSPCWPSIGHSPVPQAGQPSGPLPADIKRANAFSLPSAGALIDMVIYLAPSGVPGHQALRGVVYSDAGGAPGALLGETEELTFRSTDRSDWYLATFATPLNLPAGRYWLGVISGATAGVATFGYDRMQGRGVYNADAYSDGPSVRFGSFKTDDRQLLLYSFYTVAQYFTGTTSQQRPVTLFRDRDPYGADALVAQIRTSITDTCPDGTTINVSLFPVLPHKLDAQGLADFTVGPPSEPTHYRIQVRGQKVSGTIEDTTKNHSNAVCHGNVTFTATTP